MSPSSPAGTMSGVAAACGTAIAISPFASLRSGCGGRNAGCGSHSRQRGSRERRARAALPAGPLPILLIERDCVTLSAGAVAMDVEEFERLAAAGTPTALQGAVALYQGACSRESA